MAAVLPFAAMGAFALYLERQSGPKAKQKKDDEHVTENHKAILHEYGMSAAAEHALLDRKYLQGGIINDGVGVDNTMAKHMQDPNVDVMAVLAEEQISLAAFDRWDTELAYHLQQGQIIPRKNNQIAIALTEEVSHPDDSSKRSTFYVSKFSPAYANQQQIADADRMLQQQGETPAERSLRAWNGSQFFETAAGQSFRYSED